MATRCARAQNRLFYNLFVPIRSIDAAIIGTASVDTMLNERAALLCYHRRLL